MQAASPFSLFRLPFSVFRFRLRRLGGRCASVTPQERQRTLIEFGNVLIEARVRAPIENEQLGAPDAALRVVSQALRRTSKDT
jgi:hypothetical protein